jgi:hypothetical protein
VQVVEVAHARHFLDGIDNRLGANVGWHRFEQDVDGGNQDAPRAPGDQRGDGKTQQGVDDLPPALSSMWRLCKLGYRIGNLRPSLFAYGLVVVARPLGD